MEHLEKIFKALQVTDLKIKVSKCKFFKKHVSYLGFLIGETGIHCDRSKVKAINKITTPTSIEEVRQFNGMCLYYHKFISHYSDISKCFNDMTRKGATFNWTKECNAMFKLLKEKLMENPVLISPQVDKDYVIMDTMHKIKYESKHLPIPNKPFDGICLDCVGPLERSKQGFKWILNCIDLHS